ncbi:TetR/AcrR family transcriptional regulator [Mycobacterium sp.]|uniref:TetR/AcrR family transcriptional regulator n=1 Tax=Mycobacterium sp. TaxID=1785 RepID=UPI003BB0B744
MKTVEAVGGRKLEPDARVRRAILTAASKVVREEGVRALSVAEVLARTRLSTRAFYRHFDSKDQLVSAVFLEMARTEMMRLEQKMATTGDPVRAVAAWIAGRLDLAFDDQIRSDLRQMSLEAQSQMFASPELIGPAYQEMLRPLVDEIERGNDLGAFPGVDPMSEALSIHGVVWANVERQWSTGCCDPREISTRVQRFCLRGLGVAPAVITEVLDEVD